MLPCPEPAHRAPGCPIPGPEPEPPRSRWTLAAIEQVCAWLRGYSRSGVWRVLRSLEIHRKRGRLHVHSPDPDYVAKLARVGELRDLVAGDPERRALLYPDEVTYYRQPTVGPGYAPAGRAQAAGELGHARNTPTRVVAALDGRTGRVACHQAGRIGVPELVRFYERLCAAYPARRLYVVQDNWPVHCHPDVLAALEPQDTPFPWVYPRTWPTEPGPQARRLNLPIQLVMLPTYASWANPIEKLWRRLKQDVLHLHPWAADLPELRRQVLASLAGFADGSEALLRYIGLAPPDPLARIPP